MEQSVLNGISLIILTALIIYAVSHHLRLKEIETATGNISKLIWCAENPPAFHIGEKTKHGVCCRINLKEVELLADSYYYEFRFNKGKETVLVHQGSLGI